MQVYEWHFLDNLHFYLFNCYLNKSTLRAEFELFSFVDCWLHTSFCGEYSFTLNIWNQTGWWLYWTLGFEMQISWNVCYDDLAWHGEQSSHFIVSWIMQHAINWGCLVGILQCIVIPLCKVLLGKQIVRSCMSRATIGLRKLKVIYHKRNSSIHLVCALEGLGEGWNPLSLHGCIAGFPCLQNAAEHCKTFIHSCKCLLFAWFISRRGWFHLRFC